MAEQKRSNPHLANRNEAEFVALRNARDQTLPMPKRMSHALPVNIAGGRFPEGLMRSFERRFNGNQEDR